MNSIGSRRRGKNKPKKLTSFKITRLLTEVGKPERNFYCGKICFVFSF